MATLDPAIAALLKLLDEGFDRAAWHGPTLLGAVRRITPAQADWRPGRGRHSIRELTLHAAYWKHVVRGRLTGGDDEAFALPGRNWFAANTSRSWKEDLRLLVDEHRRLRGVVAAFPPRALDRPIDVRKQTAAYSIRGIAMHDVYHAAQIRLLHALQ
jgi:uncharacterized damage-inducible protein DinB